MSKKNMPWKRKEYSMPAQFDLELAEAAYKLVHDQLKLKKGESILITTDSVSEFRVAEEIAKMSQALGGKVMVAWHTTPVGYGAMTEPYLPEPLIACADKTDVWVELNNQWLLYSSFWDKAVTNGRTRQIMLGDLDIEQLVRLIGKVDIPAQKEFQDMVVAKTRKAKSIRITSPAGTDVRFENDPDRPINSEIEYDTPGAHFLLGQIGWAPKEETIHGRISFDGALSGGGEAELGLLKGDVISYLVEQGRIKDFEGGAKAEIIRKWFEKIGEPNMYLAAHVCYGFHPTARLEGTTNEDERIWGSTQWGFGHQGSNFTGKEPRVASGHIDGICLNSTVYLDGEKLTSDGEVVDPELKQLAAKVGR
jgi:2,5-dihydroxypyridine 5,6-dioxygenase